MGVCVCGVRLRVDLAAVEPMERGCLGLLESSGMFGAGFLGGR